MAIRSKDELLTTIIQVIKDNGATDSTKTKGSEHKSLEIDIVDTLFDLISQVRAEIKSAYLVTREVADIAGRDALITVPQTPIFQDGEVVLVNDASADPDIASGWAIYLYNASATNPWLLLQKQENLSLALIAANVLFDKTNTRFVSNNVQDVLKEISDYLSTLIPDPSNPGNPASSGERVSKKIDGANFTPGVAYAWDKTTSAWVLADYDITDAQTITGFALSSEELVLKGFVSGLNDLNFTPNKNYYLSRSTPGELVDDSDPTDVGTLVLSVMTGGLGVVYDDGRVFVAPGGPTDLSNYYTKAESNALLGAKVTSNGGDIDLTKFTPTSPSLWSTLVSGGKVLVGAAFDYLRGLFYTKSESDALLAAKADLVSGKVPLSQLPDAILGQVKYQGTYNASTGNVATGTGVGSALPTAASANLGWYYIVTTAGTQFGKDFGVGDWIISNGSSWDKVDNTDAVMSVFGRTGPVTAQNGDYNAGQITNTPSGNISATTVQAALNELDTEKAKDSEVVKSVSVNGGTPVTPVGGNVDITVSVGSSGTSAKKTYTQASHGFTPGLCLRRSGGVWVKSQANSDINSDVLGIIESVPDANTFVLVFSGEITLSGLTADTKYYLSDGTLGGYTPVAPITTGSVKKQLFTALSTTVAVLQIFEGYVIFE